MSENTQKIQVAFASTDGTTIDGHFGSCEHFFIYTVDRNSKQKVEVREALSGRGLEKNSIRTEIISDCHLLFCASIGGPAAARVIRAGIHPMKCKLVDNKAPSISEQLDLLQQRMQSESLPPWLAKLTGQANKQQTHFETLS